MASHNNFHSAAGAAGGHGGMAGNDPVMPGMQWAPPDPKSRLFMCPSLVTGSAPASAPCWDERMSPPSHPSPGVQRVLG